MNFLIILNKGRLQAVNESEAIDFRPEDYHLFDNGTLQFYFRDGKTTSIKNFKEGETYPKPDGYDVEISSNGLGTCSIPNEDCGCEGKCVNPKERGQYARLVPIKEQQLHPCDCKSYNGGQCYNCLNGAHEFCETCNKKNDSVLGLPIVIKEQQYEFFKEGKWHDAMDKGEAEQYKKFRVKERNNTHAYTKGCSNADIPIPKVVCSTTDTNPVIEQYLLYALEFGFKQCEQGHNLDRAIIEFNKLLNIK